MSVPNPIAKANGKINRYVRAALAGAVTLAIIGGYFLRGDIPQELMILGTFVWGYYFGEPVEQPKP